jgi:prenyltransferase beta subunit
MGGLTPTLTNVAVATSDGGARQGPPDLWCTYAAVRTLRWLGVRPASSPATARVLSGHQNADGGFAWQRGLPSDAWATYYCTQALEDLGWPVAHRSELASWLDQTRHCGGGFAMTPGQSPDVWATYYATRTMREILDRPIGGPERLRQWLAALQRDDGGLSWSPQSMESDVRACYYGTVTWRAAFNDAAPPWRVADLARWIQARQCDAGGLNFAADGQGSCLWATFRGVRALAALDGRGGAAWSGADRCADWIVSRQLGDGGFSRWDGDRPADVWACFSAVGALQTLGRQVPELDRVIGFVESCALPEGGFTYREPEAAGDSLATAAMLLVGAAEEDAGDRVPLDAAARWLHQAHLPYEDGVMYMPGRGAEVRCTLWAVSALAHAGRPSLDGDRLTGWLRRLQNADGGWGYWQGRASDVSSTVSALEVLAALDRPLWGIDTAAAGEFLRSCHDANGYGPTPGAAGSCAATAQAARAWFLLGDPGFARTEAATLEAYASNLGGYASRERGVPDLVSTYQSVLTRQRLDLPVDDASRRRFLDKVRLGRHGYAWSPLSRTPGGSLASALGTLLDHTPMLVPLNL